MSNKLDPKNFVGEVSTTIASCDGPKKLRLTVEVDLDTSLATYTAKNLKTNEIILFELNQAGKVAAVEQYNAWLTQE